MSCYDNIIGLAPTNYKCIVEVPEELRDTVQKSISGLFISDLGVLDILGDEFRTSTMWTSLDQNRTQATLAFIAETNTLLQKKVRHRTNPYQGKIGEQTANSLVEYTGNKFQGVRLYCNNIKSAFIYIKNIELYFEGDNQRTLFIKDKYNNQIYFNDTIAPVNGKFIAKIDKKLLTANQDGSMEYFIYYNNSESRAKNNRIVCPDCTGFKAPFDKTNLPFNQNYKSGIGWANWLMLQGIKFDNDSFFNVFDENVDVTWTAAQNAMNGIVLDVAIGCGIDDILCEQVQNFSINPFAMSIAKAIQLKTAELFTTYILSSNRISRTTLINHEQLAEMRQEWRMEYNEIINYITSNIEVSDSDCFNCRGLLDIGLGRILT